MVGLLKSIAKLRRFVSARRRRIWSWSKGHDALQAARTDFTEEAVRGTEACRGSGAAFIRGRSGVKARRRKLFSVGDGPFRSVLRITQSCAAEAVGAFSSTSGLRWISLRAASRSSSRTRKISSSLDTRHELAVPAGTEIKQDLLARRQFGPDQLGQSARGQQGKLSWQVPCAHTGSCPRC